MVPFWEPDEAVVSAVHPAAFAIHAHAAGHTAFCFLDGIVLRKALLDFGVEVPLFDRETLPFMAVCFHMPMAITLVVGGWASGLVKSPPRTWASIAWAAMRPW